MKSIYLGLMILALGLIAVPSFAGTTGSGGSCCASNTATTAATCPAASTGAAASLASAGDMHEMHSDKHMEMDADVAAAVEHSAAIAAILAGDEIEGVPAHAEGLATALRLGEQEGEHSMHNMAADPDSPAAQLTDQLAILADESTGIKEAREAFLTMQEVFIPLVERAYARQDGEPEWAVYRCDMAKGSWIQPAGKVANPFYGSKMLRCGKKVAALGEGVAKKADEGHGAHSH